MTTVHKSKVRWRFSQNFVAFSELWTLKKMTRGESKIANRERTLFMDGPYSFFWTDSIQFSPGESHKSEKAQKSNFHIRCKKIKLSKYFKVHIFWEGHKLLRNLHLTFDWHYIGQKCSTGQRFISIEVLLTKSIF